MSGNAMGCSKPAESSTSEWLWAFVRGEQTIRWTWVGNNRDSIPFPVNYVPEDADSEGCCSKLENRMKALVKGRAERGLWLEEIAEPAIGINDVLIRVRYTGTSPIYGARRVSTEGCTL
jgi:hypothetical protein